MIPTDSKILSLLDELSTKTADDLETQFLDFKPWTDAKTDMKVAVEYAVCFANAKGGVVVFGVADRVRGRAAAIHGAKGYDLDVWRRAVWDSTRPHIQAEVHELAVPEGTGRLLVVRILKGTEPPYGTTKGYFSQRVGKNCMPLDAASFARSRISSGALDWSGAETTLRFRDLDPVEVARGKNILRRFNPESDLLRLSDEAFTAAVGGTRHGHVTHAGLLIFGREESIVEICPQHQVHYVFQISDTAVARNDSYRTGLLQTVERIEQHFSGPANPEQELSVGLFKIRIPAFPLEVVRESLLNAVTHRDYSSPGEVMIRHTPRELVVTSPGGFLGGITPENILRQEPLSRNRTLAEIFEKLRLVERAGIGRRRIFIPPLSYGKRAPRYETDGQRVTLRVFDGTFDAQMAALVSKWNRQGIEIGLDGLLVLSHLREHSFLDAAKAAELLQLSRDESVAVLESFTHPPSNLLERRGRFTASFHLSKDVAIDLRGRAAYTRTKGVNPIRYQAMVEEFIKDHARMSPAQMREVCSMGETRSARTEASRLLRKWSGPEGFLIRHGKPPHVHYTRRKKG